MACLGRFHGNRSGWSHLMAFNQDLPAMRDIQLWASVYSYLLSTWSHETNFPCHKIALVMFVTLFYCLALTTAKLRPNVRGFTATHMTLRSCRSNPASLIKIAVCPVHIFFSEIYLTNYEKICDFSFHLLSIFIWAKVKSDWCSHI